jgi:hypothetical protein
MLELTAPTRPEVAASPTANNTEETPVAAATLFGYAASLVWIARSIAANSAFRSRYSVCVRPVNPTFKAARGYAMLFRAPA